MADNDNDNTIIISNLDEELARVKLAAQEKNACLLGIGGEINHIVFELIPGTLIFGRGSDACYCLELEGVSRRHFKIDTDQGGATATLSDLGSRNGTYLNNQRLSNKQTLSKGDIIKSGAATMRYIPPGDPERLTYDKISMEVNTDELTGCFNKVYFNQAADGAVCNAKITGNSVSLLMLDIDNFGKVNNSIGKHGGDIFLREMALVIGQQNIEQGGVLARLGEDTFALLVPGADLVHGFKTAEGVRKAIQQYEFRYDFRKWPITVSLGVAEVLPGVNSGRILLKLAAQGVYLAKENGRNQVGSVQCSG